MYFQTPCVISSGGVWCISSYLENLRLDFYGSLEISVMQVMINPQEKVIAIVLRYKI